MCPIKIWASWTLAVESLGIRIANSDSASSIQERIVISESFQWPWTRLSKSTPTSSKPSFLLWLASHLLHNQNQECVYWAGVTSTPRSAAHYPHTFLATNPSLYQAHPHAYRSFDRTLIECVNLNWNLSTSTHYIPIFSLMAHHGLRLYVQKNYVN